MTLGTVMGKEKRQSAWMFSDSIVDASKYFDESDGSMYFQSFSSFLPRSNWYCHFKNPWTLKLIDF